MSLVELKESALAAGYTKIQLDGGGAQPVSLKDWNGVWTGIAGQPGAIITAYVAYHLGGDRVRVQKATEKEIWYRLS